MTLRITPPRVLVAALAAVALAACSAPGTTEPDLGVDERARFSASGDTATVSADDGGWSMGSGGVTELQSQTAGDSIPSGELRGVYGYGSGG